jgi:hypothetical protein
MIDIALIIEFLIPEAQYSGFILNNSQEEYNNLRWTDGRPKPTWAQILEGDLGAKVTQAKENRIAFIQNEYDIHSVEGIPVFGVEWFGGYISGIKIDAKKRLSLELNAPNVVIHDIQSMPHTLTYEQVSTVIHAIGIKYEMDFARRAARFASIEAASTMSDKESAITAINNMVW